MSRSFRLCTAALAISLAMTAVAAKPKKAKPAEEKLPAVSQQQLLEALHTVSGPHPGYRATHAKGVMLTGTFEPTIQAALMSRAHHFHFPVQVVVRFSDSSGLPDIADGNPNAGPRGMSIRFKMPDGHFTDIVMHSYNGFPVRTGAEFGALLRAVAESADSKAKQTPLDKFLAGHPAAKRFFTTPKPVPDSFATETFYGVNAMGLRDDHNRLTLGRYQLVPYAQGTRLSAQDLSGKSPNFLADEIRERVKHEAIAFDLMLQEPVKGDKIDDATAVWPDSRQRVRLGTVYLNLAVPDSEAAEKQIAFNPLNLVDGVEMSDDPLLTVRGSTYALGASERGVAKQD